MQFHKLLHGSWGPDATLLISQLGRRIAVVTGELWSASFIDIAMQRGSAAAILGPIPPVSDGYK